MKDYNKITKETIHSILALLGMLLIVYVMIYIDEKDADEIIQNGVKTIGNVSPRIGNVFMTYTLNKKQWSNYQNSPFSGIQEGEKYVIIADKRKFNNILIEFDKPVILRKDINYFRKTKTQLIEKNLFNYGSVVKFSYLVKGVLYKRFQKIPINQKIDFSEKNIYEVIYDLRNPKIAYLLLTDIPIIFSVKKTTSQSLGLFKE